MLFYSLYCLLVFLLASLLQSLSASLIDSCMLVELLQQKIWHVYFLNRYCWALLCICRFSKILLPSFSKSLFLLFCWAIDCPVFSIMNRRLCFDSRFGLLCRAAAESCVTLPRYVTALDSIFLPSTYPYLPLGCTILLYNLPLT